MIGFTLLDKMSKTKYMMQITQYWGRLDDPSIDASTSSLHMKQNCGLPRSGCSFTRNTPNLSHRYHSSLSALGKRLFLVDDLMSDRLSDNVIYKILNRKSILYLSPYSIRLEWKSDRGISSTQHTYKEVSK
jgi:hypothetical protein